MSFKNQKKQIILVIVLFAVCGGVLGMQFKTSRVGPPVTSITEKELNEVSSIVNTMLQYGKSRRMKHFQNCWSAPPSQDDAKYYGRIFSRGGFDGKAEIIYAYYENDDKSSVVAVGTLPNSDIVNIALKNSKDGYKIVRIYPCQ